MAAFTLTLVRHGETAHNKSHIIQGQLDVPLSSVGIDQARLLGEHLRQEQWTHVYCSDLSRAKQTAEELVKCSQVFNGDIKSDPLLRERRFGELQGKEFSILKELAYKAGRRIFDYCPPGGETLKEMRSRAASFFTSICQNIHSSHQDAVVNGHVAHDGDADKVSIESPDDQHNQSVSSLPTDANILVVSHGGLILEMMHYFVQELDCEMPKEKNKALRISPNAAVSKFRVSINDDGHPQGVVCLFVHNTDHLTSQSRSAKTDGDSQNEISL